MNVLPNKTPTNISLSTNISTSSKVSCLLVIIYVVSVLTIDILGSCGIKKPIDFGLLKMPFLNIISETLETKHFVFFRIFSHFDVFKFLFWLVIPIFIFRRYIDLKWFTISKLGQSDLIILLLIILICLLSLSAIFIFPSLKNYYSTVGFLPPQAKIIFIVQQLFWLCSWLPAWEFLNRHLLLRMSENLWRGKGWFLVPIVETLYHLIKPLPEAIGMFIFSLVATRYTAKRENNIPAFLCHLVIELGLIGILVLF